MNAAGCDVTTAAFVEVMLGALDTPDNRDEQESR